MKKKLTIGDVLAIAIYILLLTVDISLFIAGGNWSITGIIERVIIITISYVGLMDIWYRIGFHILLPNFYKNAMKKQQDEIIQSTIKSYFNEESSFFKSYGNERAQFILSQLGLNPNKFGLLKRDLIKMREMTVISKDSAQEKLKPILSDAAVIVNQKGIDASNLNYDKVNYFINFNDLVFDRKYVNDLAYTLAYLILENEHFSEIKKIIIPHDSNFLLGVEVGNRLGLPVIHMRNEKGRIMKDKPWDGNLGDNEKVIIVHDVLVTGKQVIDAIEALPKTCEIIAFFCLVVRKEFNGKSAIEERKIEVNSIIDLNDKDIEEIIGGVK